ncbi:MAG: hypothetical protein LBV41_13870 [Cytophagaceae bacterium]|jgi:hypothetical protein|nr:hypothetical protein [Cytophagaceae bacterium]
MIPSAHVRVFSDGRVFLFAADAKGRVNIEYSSSLASDSVQVTSVGYKPFRLLCSELKKNENIVLESGNYFLGEVVVKTEKSRKRKTMKLGNTDLFALGAGRGMANFQYVLYIPYSMYAGTVLKVRYYMGSIVADRFKSIGTFKNRPFRVRLYEKDTLNNTVGRDMLDDILIVSTDKGGWFEVDVSQYGLEMPRQGVFAGFEILTKEYYTNREITKELMSTFDEENSTNSVLIGWTHQKKGTLIEKWRYNPFADKWSQEDGPPDSYYLINIEVEKDD